MTTRNEAAERLRAEFIGANSEATALLDVALATERQTGRLEGSRATVERIREGYHGDKSHWFGQWLDSLLDEEAARES